MAFWNRKPPRVPFLAMDTAPKDGTVIEIECRYGAKPWRGPFRWTDQAAAWRIGSDSGEMHPFTAPHPEWRRYPGGDIGIDRQCGALGRSFWRPFSGDLEVPYVDPWAKIDAFDYWYSRLGKADEPEDPPAIVR
jgi:hypothetical protein